MFFINNTNYVLFPLDLITNERYKQLSSHSKILYTLFLNRLNLSKINSSKFSDKNGLYIYYTNAQIQDSLCCSINPAINALKELENCGLIRKEYQKRGLPLKIYVNDVFGIHSRSYSKSMPQDKPTPKYNNFKASSVPKKEEKEVSFDIDLAEKLANDATLDFGNMKNKKRRHTSTF